MFESKKVVCCCDALTRLLWKEWKRSLLHPQVAAALALRTRGARLPKFKPGDFGPEKPEIPLYSPSSKHGDLRSRPGEWQPYCENVVLRNGQSLPTCLQRQ
ncbi:Hypothetical predicted protein [Cloeon dipterum]|uniref:Uncharacterized protein n=1 Tax=Cloeon dipterum TaxID=197152 RepID=A0A8S1CX95_9INSE|nr:Hypothetical predicted protein [Cloeon dipterum]